MARSPRKAVTAVAAVGRAMPAPAARPRSRDAGRTGRRGGGRRRRGEGTHRRREGAPALVVGAPMGAVEGPSAEVVLVGGCRAARGAVAAGSGSGVAPPCRRGPRTSWRGPAATGARLPWPGRSSRGRDLRPFPGFLSGGTPQDWAELRRRFVRAPSILRSGSISGARKLSGRGSVERRLGAGPRICAATRQRRVGPFCGLGSPAQLGERRLPCPGRGKRPRAGVTPVLPGAPPPPRGRGCRGPAGVPADGTSDRSPAHVPE